MKEQRTLVLTPGQLSPEEIRTNLLSQIVCFPGQMGHYREVGALFDYLVHTIPEALGEKQARY